MGIQNTTAPSKARKTTGTKLAQAHAGASSRVQVSLARQRLGHGPAVIDEAYVLAPPVHVLGSHRYMHRAHRDGS